MVGFVAFKTKSDGGRSLLLLIGLEASRVSLFIALIRSDYGVVKSKAVRRCSYPAEADMVCICQCKSPSLVAVCLSICEKVTVEGEILVTGSERPLQKNISISL